MVGACWPPRSGVASSAVPYIGTGFLATVRFYESKICAERQTPVFRPSRYARQPRATNSSDGFPGSSIPARPDFMKFPITTAMRVYLEVESYNQQAKTLYCIDVHTLFDLTYTYIRTTVSNPGFHIHQTSLQQGGLYALASKRQRLGPIVKNRTLQCLGNVQASTASS